MVVDALYIGLVICNLVILAASWRFGSRVNTITCIAALLNGVALVVFLLPLVNLLLSPSPPPGAGAAIRVLLPAAGVLALQLAAMVLLFRHNTRPPRPSTSMDQRGEGERRKAHDALNNAKQSPPKTGAANQSSPK